VLDQMVTFLITSSELITENNHAFNFGAVSLERMKLVFNLLHRWIIASSAGDNNHL